MVEPSGKDGADAAPAAVEIAHETAKSNGVGIAWMVAAVTLLSIMDALAKWLSQSYPILQLVFLRSLLALIPLALYIGWRGDWRVALRTRRPMVHVVRSVVGIVSLVCFFTAFAHLPLATAVTMAFTAPLFVTALSVPLLDERVGPRRWTAVLLGFLGVLVIARPGAEAGASDPMILLPLAGAFLYALVIIFLRQMGRTESSAAIVFYYAVSAAVVSGLVMPWQWVTPRLEDWLPILAFGLAGGFGQIAITNAFRFGEVAVVAPFDYLALVWATAFGYWIWGDVPSIWVGIGAAIIVASGLYIVHRESRLGLARGLGRRLQPRR